MAYATPDQERAAARRALIADALAHAEKDPQHAYEIQSFLEQPLENPVDGDAYILPTRGGGVIRFQKRTFHSPDDRRKHLGLFDYEGQGSDLPFRMSKWSE